jgi:hypothetical protein
MKCPKHCRHQVRDLQGNAAITKGRLLAEQDFTKESENKSRESPLSESHKSENLKQCLIDDNTIRIVLELGASAAF